MVFTGLDVLIRQPDLAPKGRLGLITNHSAVTRDLITGVDAIRAAGLPLAALFGPEHGVRGDAAAGQEVDSGTDERTGLPVHSLFGEHRKPTPDMLAGLDALIFDLQDVGARYYTFLYTLSYCMSAAGEKGIPLVVLDRPNPLGGDVVEGNLVRDGFTSFVGMHPIPNRYGLTVGEMARFYRDRLGVACDLRVIPVEGWKRSMLWEDTGLAWVPPSPNIPTPDAARVYPGTCFIEGTTLSEGRGTAKPFETFGAPYIDADRLADDLNEQNLPGARWRATHFIPTFSKHRDAPCHGCQLHVTDAAALRPVAAGVHLLWTLKRLYPNDFGWLPPFGEGHTPFVDLLAGSDTLRTRLDAGAPPEEILGPWKEEASVWARDRCGVTLYQ